MSQTSEMNKSGGGGGNVVPMYHTHTHLTPVNARLVVHGRNLRVTFVRVVRVGRSVGRSGESAHERVIRDGDNYDCNWREICALDTFERAAPVGPLSSVETILQSHLQDDRCDARRRW